MYASLFSALIFFGGNLSHLQENKIFAYLSFIWKEICIVIQVHLLLGYANNYFKKEDFKFLVGPVGAIGSLGGILGGLATSYLSSRYGTRAVLDVGVLFVILPFIFFLGTQSLQSFTEQNKSPVSSLDTPDLRRYVLLICAMVASAQFIINIADFKFNLAFEKVIPTADLRTSYLGDVYTWTNALTFLFQFLVLPLLLPRITEKRLHLFIPLSYMFCLLLMNLGGHIGLWPIAGLYIYFKAADYSFFSAGKELLYQPLASAQKYGAKYLTDMLVYRASKASIAVLLIYLQSSFILDMMMGAFLLIWLIIVVKLFGLHRKLFN
jgi:AAA family ATP:ADP antiporter